MRRADCSTGSRAGSLPIWQAFDRLEEIARRGFDAEAESDSRTGIYNAFLHSTDTRLADQMLVGETHTEPIRRGLHAAGQPRRTRP
jgi:hypothetical protein